MRITCYKANTAWGSNMAASDAQPMQEEMAVLTIEAKGKATAYPGDYWGGTLAFVSIYREEASGFTEQ